MNTFSRAMSNMSDIIFTENGAYTFSTSNNANVDMFGLASAMRDRQRDLISLFAAAFSEDKEMAVRNLFYLRDVRGGQGERLSFRNCSVWLAHKLSSEEFARFIKYIPVYGRWDDLLYLMTQTDEKEKINSLMLMVRDQLREDITNMREGKSVSLLAKWFPIANNTKNPQAKEFAVRLRSGLFKSPSECRKTIVALRKYINVLEQKMSAKEWSDINYSNVPSRASKKYIKAFKRNDGVRYDKYIEDVLAGKKKMNSSAVYPHEIVYECNNHSSLSDTYDALWKNLPDYTNNRSAVCCVDVSGSMVGHDVNAPIWSSIGLGLYFAERNKGDFHNKFFTFESEPHVISVRGSNLYEKIRNMFSAPWGGSTNLYGLFKLYVDLAKKSNPEDCPKTLIIISDMEFDQAIRNGYGHSNKMTIFNKARELFKKNNVKMPTVVFWNVEARQNNLPVKFDESGAVLVSGHSPVAFRYMMEGKTPVEFMHDVLYSDRYKDINIFD